MMRTLEVEGENVETTRRRSSRTDRVAGYGRKAVDEGSPRSSIGCNRPNRSERKTTDRARVDTPGRADRGCKNRKGFGYATSGVRASGVRVSLRLDCFRRIHDL